MGNVHDVAAHILKRTGSISTWKLQKLVYYSQAWHLVWEEEPLFRARIEAWANGPVVPELYKHHRGRFSIDKWPAGDPSRLTAKEQRDVNTVIDGYGKLNGRQLSHLTHSEDPWRDARGDLPTTASSTKQITPQAMQSFYTALDADESAEDIDSVDWAALD